MVSLFNFNSSVGIRDVLLHFTGGSECEHLLIWILFMIALVGVFVGIKFTYLILFYCR